MPHVYPFRAVTFAGGGDLSALVAPPYDVLDAGGKAALLAKDARNIVGIDLPHVPAKDLGPAEVYADAGRRFRELFSHGTLKRAAAPVMFAYRQTFKSSDGSASVARTGMACCVPTVPFGARDGGGILPHEETFSGPKEDRLALMNATRAQLSPIFGLHADDRGVANQLLAKITSSRRADVVATTPDGTLHETWTINDEATIGAYQRALAGEDIFIADGHHRYTTALNYAQQHMAASGGSIGEDHPSRRCMMVLVGMSDPGLVIWPTHRVLGGMSGYSFEKFAKATEKLLIIRPAAGSRAAGLAAQIEGEMNACTLPPPPFPRNVFGLYDYASKRSYTATLAQSDPLLAKFPDKIKAWRELDVAVIQHAIVEAICRPMLNGNAPVQWAFPHTIAEVEAMGSGSAATLGFEPQLAIVVRPTPLKAVRDISRANVLMPQKSTFFYPKLATGLFMYLME